MAYVLRIFFFLFLVLSGGEACAGNVPPTCDEDYWDVMKARAWEGGEREMTQNRNIIAKSDSVLSYCFYDYLDHLAEAASHMFPGHPQESAGIGGGAIPGAGLNINRVLEVLILDTLLQANQGFGAKMLGERSGFPSSYKSVKDTVFDCKYMNNIWLAAKCYNFQTEISPLVAQENDHDGFYVFEEYVDTQLAGDDFRRHIRNRRCAGIAQPIPWDAAHLAANPVPGAAGGMDDPVTYLNLLDPSACGGVKPVDTGIEVTDQAGVKYQDAICIAPGCRYTGPGGKCVPP